MKLFKIDTLNDGWANIDGYHYGSGTYFVVPEEGGDGELVVTIEPDYKHHHAYGDGLCSLVSCRMSYTDSEHKPELSYDMEVSGVRPGLMFLDVLKVCAKAFNEALSASIGVKVEVTEGGVA